MYEARLYFYADNSTYDLRNLEDCSIMTGSSIAEIRFLMGQRNLIMTKGGTQTDQFGMRYAKVIMATQAEMDGFGEPDLIHMDTLVVVDRIERHYYNGEKVY